MALKYEEIEAGVHVTHKNTGLRYAVVDAGEEEVLLTPDAEGSEDLLVPVALFTSEFISSDKYSTRRGRGRKSSPAEGSPVGGGRKTISGPKLRGRIKKMVRDRGFGFIRGDDGKEVFFHRSGLSTAEYDALEEGQTVEYQISESPRGPRAENVRPASA